MRAIRPSRGRRGRGPARAAPCMRGSRRSARPPGPLRFSRPRRARGHSCAPVHRHEQIWRGWSRVARAPTRPRRQPGLARHAGPRDPGRLANSSTASCGSRLALQHWPQFSNGPHRQKEQGAAGPFIRQPGGCQAVPCRGHSCAPVHPAFAPRAQSKEPGRARGRGHDGLLSLPA